MEDQDSYNATRAGLNRLVWREVRAAVGLPDAIGLRLMEIPEYRNAAIDFRATGSQDAQGVMALIQHEFLHPPRR